MSFFGKKKEKAPTPQEAIQRIRDVEDLLGKKQAYLEKKITDELDSARKYGTKNKRSNLFSIICVEKISVRYKNLLCYFLVTFVKLTVKIMILYR